jgi:hypothetical protein
MNVKNIFILTVVIIVGTWYFKVGGSKVSRAHVEVLYADYMAAFDRGDGKAVCEFFSKEVSGSFQSTSKSFPVNEHITKESVCSSVDNFQAAKDQLEKAVGHELYTNFEYTINDVAISPDGKSATAKVVLEFRIGTEQRSILDMRSTQVDVIERSLGKTYFKKTSGTVSFFR